VHDEHRFCPPAPHHLLFLMDVLLLPTHSTGTRLPPTTPCAPPPSQVPPGHGLPISLQFPNLGPLRWPVNVKTLPWSNSNHTHCSHPLYLSSSSVPTKTPRHSGQFLHLMSPGHHINPSPHLFPLHSISPPTPKLTFWKNRPLQKSSTHYHAFPGSFPCGMPPLPNPVP